MEPVPMTAKMWRLLFLLLLYVVNINCENGYKTCSNSSTFRRIIRKLSYMQMFYATHYKSLQNYFTHLTKPEKNNSLVVGNGDKKVNSRDLSIEILFEFTTHVSVYSA